MQHIGLIFTSGSHSLLFSHDQCWPAVLHRGDPHVGGHLRRGHHHGAGPGHHAHHRQHHEAENHCQDGLSGSGARHANQELPGKNDWDVVGLQQTQTIPRPK